MIYQFENFSYNYDKGVIIKRDEDFRLTLIQKKLLNYFIKNPQTIHSKQTLMEQVWGRILTENSVDQVIYILRGYIEKNPKKPKIMVTHFGHGISFEAEVIQSKKEITSSKTPKLHFNILKIIAIVILPIIIVLWINNSFFNEKVDIPPKFSKKQKILILPSTFIIEGLSPIKQQGVKSLLKSTFNSLESEGQIIFDQSSLTTQQAIEKHWQRESDLVFLRTAITKKGDKYESLIELTDGQNILNETTISASNMSHLLNKQMLIISDFSQAISKEKLNTIIGSTPDESFIQALGFKNKRKLKQAKKSLNQTLSNKGDHYLARFTLAEIYFEEKQYELCQSQLNTLKATKAYDLMGTEIELALAEIKYVKHRNIEIIEDLKNYQVHHLTISSIKKAKIKLTMAKAYLALADNKSALDFYKQALQNIDEQLNPLIYAQSYLGQAKILTNQSIGNDAYSLYQKALNYAESAGDLHHQMLALNGMSHVALSSYDWEKSITFQRQAIELMELDNNKEQVAVGLENLVSVLNLRGQFSEARSVNKRLGDISEELNSDTLRLHYMHFDAILSMNTFDWAHAQKQIDKTLNLAIKIGDYGMQLNNAFTALELILLKKDTVSFMPEWNKRAALIQQKGFERFQVYMELYLARYYKQTEKNQDAIDLLENISEKLISGKDFKMLVDAQNQLAMVYLKSDATKALTILNNLEQHNPHPNPYLDLKAKALYKLGNNIEALSILNQAKLVYHESWTAENQ
ncbi:MAG: winged helix-turn-helix domain-containing protein, partial [Bacteroidota bacterium]